MCVYIYICTYIQQRSIVNLVTKNLSKVSNKDEKTKTNTNIYLFIYVYIYIFTNRYRYRYIYSPVWNRQDSPIIN